ncbi:MAG: phosphoribosylanthranilate isomerase [Fidelibacterota bacterium]
MKRWQLKICGIRKREEAECCVRLGVDYIGLNFVPASRRSVSRTVARRILDNLPPIPTVGVFQNQPLAFVNETATRLNLDYIQLSGEESDEEIGACCRPVIKTVTAPAGERASHREYRTENIAFFILDGHRPGSGQSFDWTHIPELHLPFLLAGGLTPDNVREAIRQTAPLGIDVASGVETGGEIDCNKIQEMVTILCS